MTRRTTLLCSLLAISGALGAIIATTGLPTSTTLIRPPAREAIDENPNARAEWEWMQLRDPISGMIPRGIERAERIFARTIPSRASHLFARRDAAASAYTWKQRSPYNIGGRTRAFVFDVTNDNIILAGGITSGMWRSTNRGSTWQMTTLPDQLPSVTCVAQDIRPGKTNIWYHGTGDFRTNSDRFGNTGLTGDGIYKSTDGGRSWKPLPSTVKNTPHLIDQPFDFVSQIIVDSTNATEDEVYAAAHQSIMRSTDGGATWSTTLGGPGNSGFTTIAMTRTGVLYAGFGSGGAVEGIWRSKNGTTWDNITPPNWGDSARRVVLAIPPSNQDALFVLAETPGKGKTIMGSYGFPESYSLWKLTGDPDAGGSWHNRSNNLPNLNDRWNFNGLHSFAMMVAVAPSNENIVYVGGTNLYRSDNGFTSSNGTRWLGGYDENGSHSNEGSLHPDQHVLLFDRTNPEIIYSASDGGISTTNASIFGPPVWTPLNAGYITTQFYTVAIDYDDPGSTGLVGGLQDNGTFSTLASTDEEPWKTPFGGDGSFCAIASSDEGKVLYVSSQNGYMARLTAGTIEGPWNYARIDPLGGSGYLFLAPFALDPSDRNILYLAGGRTLWRNNDPLSIPANWEWEPAVEGWEQLMATTSEAQISAIGVSSTGPAHRIYYGTTAGNIFRLDDANSGDPTPVDITGNGFHPGAYVNCIAVDPHDGDRAIAVFTNYNVQSLFHTTDGGNSWSAIGGNLEEHPDGSGAGPSCRWATIVHRGAGTYYLVGTTTGLYMTEKLNGMETVWMQEGTETMGNVRVDMIAAREEDGFVAVATWGRGVFTSQLPVASVNDLAERAGLRLDGSYPNPIRNNATIRFAIPEEASGKKVRLTLVDALGREVGNVLEEKLPAGEHRATVDLGAGELAALPSGIYFCRLECGEMMMVRQVRVER